jgi:hypothetical protein
MKSSILSLAILLIGFTVQASAPSDPSLCKKYIAALKLGVVTSDVIVGDLSVRQSEMKMLIAGFQALQMPVEDLDFVQSVRGFQQGELELWMIHCNSGEKHAFFTMKAEKKQGSFLFSDVYFGPTALSTDDQLYYYLNLINSIGAFVSKLEGVKKDQIELKDGNGVPYAAGIVEDVASGYERTYATSLVFPLSQITFLSGPRFEPLDVVNAFFLPAQAFDLDAATRHMFKVLVLHEFALGSVAPCEIIDEEYNTSSSSLVTTMYRKTYAPKIGELGYGRKITLHFYLKTSVRGAQSYCGELSIR